LAGWPSFMLGAPRSERFEEGDELLFLFVSHELAEPMSAIEHEVRAFARGYESRTSLLGDHFVSRLFGEMLFLDLGAGAEEGHERRADLVGLGRIEVHEKIDGRAARDWTDVNAFVVRLQPSIGQHGVDWVHIFQPPVDELVSQ